MANKRISSLDDITLVGGTSTAEVNANDILPITDVDDTTGSPQGTTKAVKVSDLMGESPVQSVAGRTGAVVLDADDIDDSSTSHKFVTASDITNLSNLSGTNSGDQDLSALATQVSLGNHEALTSLVHGISAFGATLVDDADAATARTTLDVDQAGTDNSTDVTLATVPNNYLSLSGQEITAGVVPVSLGGTGSGDLTTARANLGLGTAATTASTDYATASQGALADTAIQPSGITNMVETTDSIDVLADVDTSTVAPTTNDFLNWDGSNWVPAVPSADVDTPLTTALRGTDNPHIGAYPNQSFKVTDNPNKSVMVIADADGNLEFLTKDGANVFVNTPSSRLALAKGFSIQADGSEPDIEAVDTDGTTYSVISGDTDTKGANGLPTRQGFNYPDIGANPAPILISGGSIV
jgi:hypothetical protein